VALSTHSLKAGTRLVANGSPEPFSNIFLSLTEDVTVLGGLALIHSHPVVVLGLVIAAMAAIFYWGPRILRAVRVKLWLIWRKLNSPAGPAGPVAELPKKLPADADILLHTLGGGTVAWAVPCVAGPGQKKLVAHAFGHLVALEEPSDRLFFVSRGRLRKLAATLELAGHKATQESKFLSENLGLYAMDGRRQVFLFERAQRALVARLVEELESRLGSSATAISTST
jgi:hypothetical protein